jgi:ferric-dicitrate binding protein FerR (iron transport regulator)
VNTADPDPFDDTAPWDAVASQVAGKATGDDQEAVAYWVSGHPERAELIDTLAGAVRVLREEREEKTNHSWVRFMARRDQTMALPMRQRTGTVLHGSSLMTRACVALAVVFAVALIWRDSHGVTKSRDSAAFDRARIANEYRTTAGQQTTVTLSDGSRIRLAPRTTLAIENGFGTRTRRVWITGEAYFEIARAEGAPFVVRSGSAQIRVLGTAFGIRHDSLSHRVQVAVVDGKVSVTSALGRGGLTLVAGGVGTVIDSTLATTPEDPQLLTAWTTGRLVFQEVPATEVMATLSRWYGYRFVFADSSMASQRVTIGLSSVSAVDAFATLRTVLDADVTFDTRDKMLVIIHPKSTSGNVRPDGYPQPGARRAPFTREVGR